MPGTYTVTFTLQGFNTFKRDGVEVSGSGVVTVNADMKVGEIAETITVTGQTSLVDVQQRRRPEGRHQGDRRRDARPAAWASTSPRSSRASSSAPAAASACANTNALASQDVGGTAGDTLHRTSRFTAASRPSSAQTIGGLSAATTIRFGESLSSSPSFTAMQEMTVNTSGADASMAGGGVQINYVPRDGGNTFKGLLFYSFANGAMQGTNYSSGSRDANGRLHAGRQLLLPRPHHAARRAEDRSTTSTPASAAPILKDKLWFFAQRARWTKAENYVPNDYPNRNFAVGTTSPTLLNAGTMVYTPDHDEGPLRRSAAAATSGNRPCACRGR